jgi:predicted S18 family serine protease
MDRDGWALILALIGTGCWAICFAWMHRISKRQTDLLDEIHAQGKRIEALAQAEHNLIKEVHPQVGEIKETMEEVKSVVKEDATNPTS